MAPPASHRLNTWNSSRCSRANCPITPTAVWQMRSIPPPPEICGNTATRLCAWFADMAYVPQGCCAVWGDGLARGSASPGPLRQPPARDREEDHQDKEHLLDDSAGVLCHLGLDPQQLRHHGNADPRRQDRTACGQKSLIPKIQQHAYQKHHHGGAHPTEADIP